MAEPRPGMRYREFVNADQFGFTPTSEEPAPNSLNRFLAGRKSKTISLSSQLHTRQAQLEPAVVDRYARLGWKQANKEQGPPSVVKENNQLVVRNGHHRIAAARKLGQKNMRVHYFDLDQPE